MANCQFSRNLKRAARRRSTFVAVAVCLVAVGLGNGFAFAQQQGLKIRLLSSEEGSWDQRALEFGGDVLTPPGKTESAESHDLKLLEVHPRVATNHSDLSAGSTFSPKAETFPSSILRDGIPGLPQTEAGSSIDENTSPSLLFDPNKSSLPEPGDTYQEQRQFQRNLQGIRNHLLTEEPPSEGQGEQSLLGLHEERPLGARTGNRPELVWRFSPFNGLFRDSFLGRGHPARGAFDKLFPWNRTPGRNQGVGEPLINDSWRWAPFGVGWFVGIMDGNTLVNNWTGTKPGFYGGYHLNWDFDHYWGVEFRYSFASLPQWDTTLYYEDAHGFPSEAMRKRHATFKYGDFSFLYFPWGDAKWRPYFRGGIGWGSVKFGDLNGRLWTNSTMAMPLGFGVKYRYSRRLVFRMELVDNFRFGERGINPQHNFSFTSGVEVRFGGARKAYWPYDPGRHYW